MGIMSNNMSPNTSCSNKRKGCAIDNLLEVKRSHNLQQFKKELLVLIEKKTEFLKAQKRGSLFVAPRIINEPSVMDEFSAFYNRIVNSSMEDQKDQMELIEETIKQSIIIEWPRHVPAVSSSASDTEIDFAPLIHRARNVVKCRTSHPTMRVKVCAISKRVEESSPRIVEALFRASLVKLTGDNCESKYRPVAGKMILTQREGIPATKCHEQCGAMVNAEGKLIASQSSKDAQVLILAQQLNESNVKTTRFKFENEVLCATFPEMGVTLNSMIDRRQLATRYAIQVEILMNIDNRMIINHVQVSHPFLIAITNDQTEPLLQSIYWHRLIDTDQNEPSDYQTSDALEWSILRQSICAFVKSQLPAARFLSDFEIYHIQCMILLPRLLRCHTKEEVQMVELAMFGDVYGEIGSGDVVLPGEQKRVRDRLLNEPILKSCLIERKEFMMDKCISILDMSTELNHTPWQWIHKASEMIQDVGHKLCPSPSMEKKSAKTKKQMAACEDYQTVLSLFNKGFITFCSTQMAAKAFGATKSPPPMLIRFCDENPAHFSFCYGIDGEGRPKIGSISAEQVKDFKQGLPEVIMDEHYPSKFRNILRFTLNTTNDENVVAVSKNDIFPNFATQRRKMDSVAIMDDETNRVDVLSGAQLARQTPPPSVAPSLDLSAGNMQLAQILQNLSSVDFQTFLREITECTNCEDPTTTDLSASDENLPDDTDPTNHIARMLLNQCTDI